MSQLVKTTLYLETRTDPEVSEKKKKKKKKPENYSPISLKDAQKVEWLNDA